MKPFFRISLEKFLHYLKSHRMEVDMSTMRGVFCKACILSRQQICEMLIAEPALIFSAYLDLRILNQWF